MLLKHVWACSSRSRTYWLMSNIRKLSSQQQYGRKISSKYQVLSGSLMSRMKPPSSVELHQVQGVYKWSSSISWSEAYEERKRGGENSKQKARSDHNRDESSTSWTIFSIGRISLLVCTLSPSAFLPLHFFHLSTLKALHWTGIFQVPSGSRFTLLMMPTARPLELGQEFPTCNCLELYSVCLHCCGTSAAPAELCAHHPTCHKNSWRQYTS